MGSVHFQQLATDTCVPYLGRTVVAAGVAEWLHCLCKLHGLIKSAASECTLINLPCSVPLASQTAACRPVDCISKQPGPRYLPGVLSNKIFSDQPETGWGVSTYPNSVADPGANQVYAVEQQLQTTRLDYKLETLNGTCFTFPSGKQYAVKLLRSGRFCPGILYPFSWRSIPFVEFG